MDMSRLLTSYCATTDDKMPRRHDWAPVSLLNANATCTGHGRRRRRGQLYNRAARYQTYRATGRRLDFRHDARFSA